MRCLVSRMNADMSAWRYVAEDFNEVRQYESYTASGRSIIRTSHVYKDGAAFAGNCRGVVITDRNNYVVEIICSPKRFVTCWIR